MNAVSAGKNGSDEKKSKKIGSITAAGVLTLAIAAVESLAGWAAGWKSAAQFSDGFFISGSILCLFGLLVGIGKPRFGSKPGADVQQSTGTGRDSVKRSSWLKSFIQGYNAFITLVISGALLIGISLLIVSLFV